MTKRIAQLDIIRSIAIICVVLCHVVGSVFSFHIKETYANFSSAEHFFSIAAFIIGRLGVPLFLLLTGYFLLNKTYSEKDIRTFYKTKWLKLFLVTELWLFAYYVLSCVFGGGRFNVISLVKQLLFVDASPMNHAYYLPLILGYYLTIPFVANALNSFKTHKSLRFPIIILAIFCFIVPTINDILRAFPAKPLESKLYAGFIGGAYGIYILLGFLLKKGVLKRVRSATLVIVSFIAYISCILTYYFIFNSTRSMSIWYDNIFLFITSVCLFELISRIKTIKHPRIFYVISYYSFSIYLIHNIVRFFVNVRLGNPYVDSILYTIVVFVLSLIFSYIISKIPKIGKKILYIK